MERAGRVAPRRSVATSRRRPQRPECFGSRPHNPSGEAGPELPVRHRAAASSCVRSSSWMRTPATLVSRKPMRRWRRSMLSGAPSPDRVQSASPTTAESRRWSCWTRATRRTARCWAARRSAASEALLTARGPWSQRISGWQPQGLLSRRRRAALDIHVGISDTRCREE